MYEDLPHWLLEYSSRDNYKLRVYLALLGKEMYAAELARKFKSEGMTVKELIEPSKLADHYFKPLHQEGSIKEVKKIGRKRIYTANRGVLAEIIRKRYENMIKIDEIVYEKVPQIKEKLKKSIQTLILKKLRKEIKNCLSHFMM